MIWVRITFNNPKRKEKTVRWWGYLLLVILCFYSLLLGKSTKEKTLAIQSSTSIHNNLENHTQQRWKYRLAHNPSEYFLNHAVGNACGPLTLAMTINYLLDSPSYDPENTATMLNLMLGRLPIDISIFFPKYGENIGATMPWGMVAASNAYSSFLGLATNGEYNFTATGHNRNTLDNLIEAINTTGNPVIALLNLPEGLHWIIVVGYDQDTIWTMDSRSTAKITVYDRNKFETYFTDPIIFGGITTYQGYMIEYRQEGVTQQYAGAALHE